MQAKPSRGVREGAWGRGKGGGGFVGVRGYRVTYSRYLPRPWRSSRQLSHQQATVYLGEIRQAWTGGPKEIFMPSHRARRICLSRCGGGMVSKGSREGGTGATKHSSRGVQTEASQLNLQGTCASQVRGTSSTNDDCVPRRGISPSARTAPIASLVATSGERSVKDNEGAHNLRSGGGLPQKRRKETTTHPWLSKNRREHCLVARTKLRV